MINKRMTTKNIYSIHPLLQYRAIISEVNTVIRWLHVDRSVVFHGEFVAQVTGGSYEKKK
jgi:hypothetical protein